MWKTSKFFNDKFIVKGSWNFDNALNFPHCKYLGADTETKLYYNGKLLSEDRAYRLCKKYSQKWVKSHFEVRAYAFMLSDGENFALFTNARDFLVCCAMMNVEVVFWYNARFDFAIFDYYFLTNGWTDVTERLSGQTRYGKLPHATYQSLNGPFLYTFQLQHQHLQGLRE